MFSIMLINKNKFLLLVLFFIFSLPINLISEEKINDISKKEYTQHSLNAGLSLNGNWYFSDFTEIPNCVSCAKYDGILFDFANGLSYSFWFGYSSNSKHLEKLFPNKNPKLSINLVFANLSAQYSKEIKIGNRISGDKIEELISRYTIDVALNSILLNPFVSIQPFGNNIPLSIGIGANFGILITGSFSHNEELIKPEDEFFSNGQKTINRANGDLSDKSSIFAGLALNATYDLCKIGDFIISPTLKLNYGLTNIVTSTNWKAHSANLGINIVYNVPKKIEIIEEPEIVIPEEPKPIPIVEKLNLIVNASEPNNSKIVIPVSLYEIIQTSNSLPILYFQQNSDKLIFTSNAINDSVNLDHSEQIIKKIMAASRNNHNIKIEIGISSSENDSLFESRKNAIIALLNSYKIQTDSFAFEKNVRMKKEKYDEAEEENSHAKFFINGKLEQLIETSTRKIINNISTRNINFNAVIEATAQPYSYDLDYSITRNNSLVTGTKFANAQNYDLLIDSNLLNWKNKVENADLVINCRVTDAKNNSQDTIFRYKIVPQISVDTFYNSVPNNLYKTEYILGFFTFDEDEIFAVNMDYLDKIKNFLQNGKQIEVIGTTDNLGTQNYNSGLSLQRARAAIKIIDPDNKYSNSIAIGSKSVVERHFDYSNIYARKKARVALIRILD